VLIEEEKRMSRIPKLLGRSQISEDELALYDKMVALPVKEPNTALRVKGYGKPHPKSTSGYPAMMASPPLYAAWRTLAPTFIRGQAAGRFSSTDHDIVDLVLSFDSGHWGLLPQHTFFFIAGGGRFELIEALRDGHEEALTEDERKLVQFIRQVAAGTVTDESWDWMKKRLKGNERGLLEFVFMVLYLQVHVRLMQAYEIPAITPQEYDEVLDQLRNGTWQPMPDLDAYAQFTATRDKVMGW
jgi:hypothetical protein